MSKFKLIPRSQLMKQKYDVEQEKYVKEFKYAKLDYDFFLHDFTAKLTNVIKEYDISEEEIDNFRRSVNNDDGNHDNFLPELHDNAKKILYHAFKHINELFDKKQDIAVKYLESGPRVDPSLIKAVKSGQLNIDLEKLENEFNGTKKFVVDENDNILFDQETKQPIFKKEYLEQTSVNHYNKGKFKVVEDPNRFKTKIINYNLKTDDEISRDYTSIKNQEAEKKLEELSKKNEEINQKHLQAYIDNHQNSNFINFLKSYVNKTEEETPDVIRKSKISNIEADYKQKIDLVKSKIDTYENVKRTEEKSLNEDFEDFRQANPDVNVTDLFSTYRDFVQGKKDSNYIRYVDQKEKEEALSINDLKDIFEIPKNTTKKMENLPDIMNYIVDHTHEYNKGEYQGNNTTINTLVSADPNQKNSFLKNYEQKNIQYFQTLNEILANRLSQNINNIMRIRDNYVKNHNVNPQEADTAMHSQINIEKNRFSIQSQKITDIIQDLSTLENSKFVGQKTNNKGQKTLGPTDLAEKYQSLSKNYEAIKKFHERATKVDQRKKEKDVNLEKQIVSLEEEKEIKKHEILNKRDDIIVDPNNLSVDQILGLHENQIKYLSNPDKVIEDFTNKPYKELANDKNYSNITDYLSTISPEITKEIKDHIESTKKISPDLFKNNPNKEHELTVGFFQDHIKDGTLKLPRGISAENLEKHVFTNPNYKQRIYDAIKMNFPDAKIDSMDTLLRLAANKHGGRIEREGVLQDFIRKNAYDITPNDLPQKNQVNSPESMGLEREETPKINSDEFKAPGSHIDFHLNTPGQRLASKAHDYFFEEKKNAITDSFQNNRLKLRKIGQGDIKFTDPVTLDPNHFKSSISTTTFELKKQKDHLEKELKKLNIHLQPKKFSFFKPKDPEEVKRDIATVQEKLAEVKRKIELNMGLSLTQRSQMSTENLKPLLVNSTEYVADNTESKHLDPIQKFHEFRDLVTQNIEENIKKQIEDRNVVKQHMDDTKGLVNSPDYDIYQKQYEDMTKTIENAKKIQQKFGFELSDLATSYTKDKKQQLSYDNQDIYNPNNRFANNFLSDQLNNPDSGFNAMRIHLPAEFHSEFDTYRNTLEENLTNAAKYFKNKKFDDKTDEILKTPQEAAVPTKINSSMYKRNNIRPGIDNKDIQ